MKFSSLTNSMQLWSVSNLCHPVTDLVLGKKCLAYMAKSTSAEHKTCEFESQTGEVDKNLQSTYSL